MLARPAASAALMLAIVAGVPAGAAAADTVPLADPAAAGPCAPAPERPPAEDTLAQAEAPAQPVPAEPAASAATAAGRPHANCSQNAGDQQYEDPFANEKPPTGQAGDGSGSQGQVSQTETPSTTAPVPSATADPVIATDEGPQLPSTGFPALAMLALGGLLVLSGTSLRRR